MKAIKIASGVAITALALAISAQANAAAHEGGNTEFSWNATGSMSYIYINDFENSRMDVDLNEDGDYDDKDNTEGFGLETTVSITNGPLSGDFEIVASDANDGSAATLQLENLKVTEGAFSFGMIDELTSTEEYAYDMGDSDGVYTGDTGADSQAAFRYSMDGLKVQLEGTNGSSIAGATATETATAIDTDYGVSAEYAGSADALDYVVQAQYRTSDDDQFGDDYTFVGAGVTYTADMYMAKVGINNYGTADKMTEIGYELVVTPMDALSVYAKGVNWNVSEETTFGGPAELSNYLFGAAYTAGVLTFTGEYELNQGDADDTIFGEVAYAQDMITGYASVELASIEDSNVDPDPMFEAGVGYSTASGILYAADYDFMADAQNDITLSAGYAF